MEIRKLIKFGTIGLLTLIFSAPLFAEPPKIKLVNSRYQMNPITGKLDLYISNFTELTDSNTIIATFIGNRDTLQVGATCYISTGTILFFNASTITANTITAWFGMYSSSGAIISSGSLIIGTTDFASPNTGLAYLQIRSSGQVSGLEFRGYLTDTSANRMIGGALGLNVGNNGRAPTWESGGTCVFRARSRHMITQSGYRTIYLFEDAGSPSVSGSYSVQATDLQVASNVGQAGSETVYGVSVSGRLTTTNPNEARTWIYCRGNTGGGAMRWGVRTGSDNYRWNVETSSGYRVGIGGTGVATSPELSATLSVKGAIALKDSMNVINTSTGSPFITVLRVTATASTDFWRSSGTPETSWTCVKVLQSSFTQGTSDKSIVISTNSGNKSSAGTYFARQTFTFSYSTGITQIDRVNLFVVGYSTGVSNILATLVSTAVGGSFLSVSSTVYQTGYFVHCVTMTMNGQNLWKWKDLLNISVTMSAGIQTSFLQMNVYRMWIEVASSTSVFYVVNDLEIPQSVGVGIGNTNPQAKLDVRGRGAPQFGGLSFITSTCTTDATCYTVKTDSQANVCAPQWKITNEGGFAVRFSSVAGVLFQKGMIVQKHPSYNMGVTTASANSDLPIGVVYEHDKDGVWVVHSGFAYVMLKDGVGISDTDQYLYVSDTAGRSDVQNNVTLATHNREIGHPLQTVNSGTSVLVFSIIHFN